MSIENTLMQTGDVEFVVVMEFMKNVLKVWADSFVSDLSHRCHVDQFSKFILCLI